MKNIIIGNGVNIQFGGRDYTNRRIIERAIFKLKKGDYSKEVYGAEIGDWIRMLFNMLPKFLNGEYDVQAITEDEKTELNCFKKKYTKTAKIYHIGFEDFFLMNELHCRKNKIINSTRYYAKEIMRRLFLDSIYNNGEINQIYKKYSNGFKQFLNTFDIIFTTNYDRNIEKGIEKEILYLHGAFHVLDNVYDPNSYRNQLSDRPVNTTPAIKGYEHLFSTALTGSSGALKKFSCEALENTNIALEKFAEGIQKKPEIKQEFDRLKNLDNPIIRNLTEAIELKIAKPELKFTVDYAFNKLKEIEGVVCFIGLSPNNDSHIFNIIRDNNAINKIEFLYFEKKEESFVLSFFEKKDVMPKNVRDLWEEIVN